MQYIGINKNTTNYKTLQLKVLLGCDEVADMP